MIGNVLAYWYPGPMELIVIAVMIFIVFIIPALVIILLIRSILLGSREMKKLRTEIDNLADELQQLKTKIDPTQKPDN
jgi:uncharacterized membrane protein (DUF106 family)